MRNYRFSQSSSLAGVSVAAIAFISSITSASPVKDVQAGGAAGRDLPDCEPGDPTCDSFGLRGNETWANINDATRYLHCTGYYNDTSSMTDYCEPVVSCPSKQQGQTPTFATPQNAACTAACQCHEPTTPQVSNTEIYDMSTIWLLDCNGSVPADNLNKTQDMNTYCAPVMICTSGGRQESDGSTGHGPFPFPDAATSNPNRACKSQCSCNPYVGLPGQPPVSDPPPPQNGRPAPPMNLPQAPAAVNASSLDIVASPSAHVPQAPGPINSPNPSLGPSPPGNVPPQVPAGNKPPAGVGSIPDANPDIPDENPVRA